MINFTQKMPLIKFGIPYKAKQRIFKHVAKISATNITFTGTEKQLESMIK